MTKPDSNAVDQTASQTLHLVDASIYVFRGYYSIPDGFRDRDGNAVNGVYGYAGFLLDLLERSPQYLALAFDESLTTCFRNAIYPDYKANRALPDDNLNYQFSRCRQLTELLGLVHCAQEDVEADDIIGSLAVTWRKLVPGQSPVVILTRDKDLGQLLEADDCLWDFAANARSGPAEIEAKFGVRVDQMADFLALAGDAVDNIPGAPGIGARTAAVLLQQFGSLEGLLARLDEVPQAPLRGAARLATILAEHGEQLRLYRRITGIKCDMAFTVTPDDLRPGTINIEPLLALCDELNFGRRLQDRLAKLAARQTTKIPGQ